MVVSGSAKRGGIYSPNWQYIPLIYTTYILPSRGLYNPYRLLPEPETSIEYIQFPKIQQWYQYHENYWCWKPFQARRLTAGTQKWGDLVQMIFLFKYQVIFRCHVNFAGCNIEPQNWCELKMYFLFQDRHFQVHIAIVQENHPTESPNVIGNPIWAMKKTLVGWVI